MREHLTHWLAAAVGGEASVLVLGDSIAEGFNESFANRWVEQVPALVAASLGRDSFGLYFAARYSAAIGVTSQFARAGGGFTNQLFFGPGLRNVVMGTVGSTLTRTVAGNVSQVRIRYTGFSGGGTFSWALDGSPPVNVSAAEGGSVSGRSVVIPVTPGSNKTLVLELVSGAAIIEGAEQVYGTGLPIRMINGGQAGATVNTFNANDSAQTQHVVANYAPDLVVLALGLNDYANGAVNRTLAQFQADVTLLVNRLRVARPELDVMLVIPHEVAPFNGAEPDQPWSAWREAYVALGEALDAHVLDVGSTLGSFVGGGNEFDLGDGVHVNQAGHAVIRDAVVGRLVLAAIPVATFRLSLPPERRLLLLPPEPSPLDRRVPTMNGSLSSLRLINSPAMDPADSRFSYGIDFGSVINDGGPLLNAEAEIEPAGVAAGVELHDVVLLDTAVQFRPVVSTAQQGSDIWAGEGRRYRVTCTVENAAGQKIARSGQLWIARR